MIPDTFSVTTSAAILNRLPIDNRLKLTTDFSHVFKEPDDTLKPLTALSKTRAVATLTGFSFPFTPV
jgi:hypothetical protein